ncbi:MAG: hypothetical protein WBQ57_03420, partial [Rhodanobacteraceae bacterium]
SITMSFTYYTHATRRNSLLHKAHDHLRRWGLNPPPVGQNGMLHACLFATYRAHSSARAWVRAAAGKAIYPDDAPYAFTNVY